MTTVITLTGDEAGLLRSLDNAIAKEQQHENQLKATGAAGNAVGESLKHDFDEVSASNDKVFAGILRDLRRAGPEGRATAAELQKHFAATGTAGYSSISSIVDRLAAIDPAAAAAAKSVTAEFADADARTEFNDTLTRLKRLGPEGAAIASGIAADLDAADAKTEFAKTHAELRQLAAEGDTLAKRIIDGLAAADAKTEFNDTLTQLKRLGPEGAAIAAGIADDLAAADAKAAGDMTQVLDRLKAIDPAVTHTADRIRKELADADAKTEFNNTLTQLRKLGPEGAAIAAGIADDLEAADAEAAGDMTQVLDRLKAIDPTVTQSAARVRRELADAARFSEGKFADTLDTLRSLGPEGKKVADQLKTELVTAGTLAERSIDDVIDTLHAIDPAAAEAARKIKNNLDDSAVSGTESFKKFGESAISQISQIALSYVSVQAAIALVVAANQRVIATNKEIFDGLKQNQSADIRLLQVASGDRDLFESMVSRADELAATYGIDREQARDLVGDAVGGDFEESLDFIASNAQVVPVESQSIIAGKVKTLFRDENLTDEQALNATLQAAADSADSLEEIIRALPTAAEGSSATGSTLAETAGAMAALTVRFKSGDVAATRINRLAAKFANDQEYGLSGIGLTAAVEKLQSLPEEDRRDFLGNAIELSSGYNAYITELQNIKKFSAAAEAGVASSGTEDSLIRRNRDIALTSPTFAVVREQAIAENQLTIARENRRATKEGQRQTRRAEALADAERGNASENEIAVAENSVDAVNYAASFLGTRVDDATVIRALAPGKLQDLQRDFMLAGRSGYRDVGPALLATNQLQRRRESDPDAVLSRDEVATFVRGTTGQRDFLPSEVTDDLRTELSNRITEQANDSGGMMRSLIGNVEYAFRDNIASAKYFAARPGTDAATELSRDLKTLLERNTAALEKLNDLNARSTAAAEKTADATETTAKATNTTAKNTQPKPTDPNATQRAVIATNTSRSIAP